VRGARRLAIAAAALWRAWWIPPQHSSFLLTESGPVKDLPYGRSAHATTFRWSRSPAPGRPTGGCPGQIRRVHDGLLRRWD